MWRSITIACVVLAGAFAAQAADAKPKRHGHGAGVSACLARQRASIAPLDRYGGYLPGNAPALMQAIINPILDTIRTRCLPTYNGPPQDAGWDVNSPTIAAPPAYQPSANNPACPGSIC